MSTYTSDETDQLLTSLPRINGNSRSVSTGIWTRSSSVLPASAQFSTNTRFLEMLLQYLDLKDSVRIGATPIFAL